VAAAALALSHDEHDSADIERQTALGEAHAATYRVEEARLRVDAESDLLKEPNRQDVGQRRDAATACSSCEQRHCATVDSRNRERSGFPRYLPRAFRRCACLP
jgi:hypothetical protein